MRRRTNCAGGSPRRAAPPRPRSKRSRRAASANWWRRRSVRRRCAGGSFRPPTIEGTCRADPWSAFFSLLLKVTRPWVGCYEASPIPARPIADDPRDLAHAVGQRRRARLQDDRRLHLEQLAVADRGNRVPAGARGDLVRAELLAAPGAEDDVRRAAHDFAGVLQDACLRQWLGRAFGEEVVATGNADQLGDPADAGDRRFVPFLEIDLRPPRQARGVGGDRVQAALEF